MKTRKTFRDWGREYVGSKKFQDTFYCIKLHEATAQEIFDNAGTFYTIYRGADSTEREHAFRFVSEELSISYNDIYQKWLNAPRQTSKEMEQLFASLKMKFEANSLEDKDK